MAEVDGQPGDDESQDAQQAAQDDEQEAAALGRRQSDPASFRDKVEIDGQVDLDWNRGLMK